MQANERKEQRKAAAIARMTDEKLVEALREGKFVMLEIPEQRLIESPELCMQCVELDGANLRFVPDEVRTTAFDRAAAVGSYWAFGYLKSKDKTEELLLEVIRGREIDPAMLGEEWAVPDELLTAAVAAEARALFGANELCKWTGKRSKLFACHPKTDAGECKH